MLTEKEKMLQCAMYNPSDVQLAHDRMISKLMTRRYNNLLEDEVNARCKLIKEIFGTTGEHIHVEANIRVDYGYNIHVGENFYSNHDLTILDGASVTIGDNWMIAPGVKIGNNVVIASGAVVTKDIPDNAVVAGIPATVIRQIK